MRSIIVFTLLLFCPVLLAQKAGKAGKSGKAGKVATPPPTKPPLEAVDITKPPAGTEQLDLYLLMGQSNMKGRGVMPAEPKRDPRLMMMHLKDDAWYLARHPLHLTGDAQTFEGHDNAGVGPGLAFAESLAAQNPQAAIGLIPCAVGGSPIRLWQKGAVLYDNALRRAKLALEVAAAATSTSVKPRIRGVIWLQGEADAKPETRAVHAAQLQSLIASLRADLAQPDLPFIDCTIGEMGDEASLPNKVAMNEILLALPQQVPHTACVDARDLKTHIGDHVHFDTAAQEEIGRRFAKKLSGL